MNNNINFNELWAGQKTEQPDTKKLLLKINQFKTENRKRILFTNILLLLTSLFIVCIWCYFQPQFITTKLGIILIILAMVIFVIASNRNFGLFKNIDEGENNQQYLKNLLSIKEKQQFMQTTMLTIYFVLLSVGISLYMYEYTSRMTVFGGILTYAITGLWILFNWVYLRPKQLKKQQSKLNEIISKFENIHAQFNQE